MRIALTYPHVNLVAGMERVVVESANHLTRAGHDVTVYATRWADVLEPEVRRHHVPTRPRPDALHVLQYSRRAGRALAVASPRNDVHASFTALSPPGGVYWTPSVHRAAYDEALARRSGSQRWVMRVNPFHLVRLQAERATFRPGGCALVLALTPDVKADVMRFYGVPAADIEVLPLPFDPAKFNAGRRAELRERARTALGYGERDRVVAFIANELERKGFDTLLEALARLEPEVRLLVVGRVDGSRYQSQMERLGLSDRVRFHGPSEDVGLQHAAADAFALPTRYEPWGLVIVEALASGLPVVTSRLAGAAQAVREDETGRLLDDPDDPEELAAGLRWALNGAAPEPAAISASVADLTWERVLARYEAILARVAAR